MTEEKKPDPFDAITRFAAEQMHNQLLPPEWHTARDKLTAAQAAHAVCCAKWNRILADAERGTEAYDKFLAGCGIDARSPRPALEAQRMREEQPLWDAYTAAALEFNRVNTEVTSKWPKT